MTTNRFSLFSGLLGALVLGACASDPPMRFHSLLPSEPAARAAAPTAAGAPPLAVTLAPVRVPAQVDQPQWLVRSPDGSLQLLEQDRWAAPLRDELHAALLEALAQRWGVLDSRTAAAATPAWRVTVDVTRLESVPGREARLEARWSVSAAGSGAPLLACGASLREASAGPSLAELAQGHQRSVVRLADAIGTSLRALSRAEAPRCEAPPPA